MAVDTRPPVEEDIAPLDVPRRIYAFFHNKRTGLVLILAMVVLTLLGVLFAQAPAGVRDNPEAYASWLESVRPRYRGWTDVLSALGIFRMFSSIPFLVVTSLLALSILACSAHHDQIVAVLVKEVDMGVVVVKGILHLFDHFDDQLTLVKDGGQAAADLDRGR